MSNDRGNNPESLRGNPFVARSMQFSVRDGGPTDRTCGNCFYRIVWPKDDKELKCHVVGNQPHKDFGISEDQPMPTKIDEVEVGNYCRTWVIWCAE